MMLSDALNRIAEAVESLKTETTYKIKNGSMEVQRVDGSWDKLEFDEHGNLKGEGE